MKFIRVNELENIVEVERVYTDENSLVFVKNGYGTLVVMDIEYYEKNHEKNM